MRARTAASEDLLSPRRAPISMSWDPLDLRGYSMALSGARGWGKLLLLLQLLALFPLTVRSQSGFTSVNCGGGPDGSFIDPGTGIIWQTDDGNFIATGNTAFPHISADLPDGLPQELQTLRFFPSHTKNCYVIPTQATFSYLIRVGFFYGNYDGKASSQIHFNLSLDSTAWETVTLTYDPAGVNAPLYFEAITSNATSTSISVCLIKSGVDTPFINSLEARLISSEFVYTGSFSELVNLHLVGRANFGEPTTTYRYPDDPWDRRWLPYLEEFPQLFQLEPLSAPVGQAIINSGDSSRDQPPSIVMATAVQGDLISYSRQMPATELFCAYQYFAELVTLSVFDRRYINWTTNIMTNPPAVINLTSIPSFTTYEYGYGRAFTTGSLLTYTLTPNFQSTLGAILNADEMYAVQLVAAGTSSSDVLALSKINNVLSLGQWVGDPCLPVSWDELNCSLPVALPPKVVSIDLSNHNLSGSLPAGFGNLTSLDTLLLNDNSLSGPLPSDFASLTKLRILNLGNNSFNGSFPIFLTNLKSLTSLDVSNNDFAGTFPDTLLRINFRYAGNPLLSCSGPTCPVVSSPPPLPARAPPPAPAPPLSKPTDNSPGGKKKSSLVVIIAAVVGGIAILAIIIIIAVGAYCCCTRRPAQAGTRAVEASVFAVSATYSPRSLQTASSPRSLQAASSPRSLQAVSSSRSLAPASPPRNLPPFAGPAHLQTAASPATPWAAAKTGGTNSPGSPLFPLPTVIIAKGKAQPFPLPAIRNATSNFSTKIGEGSFGSVFYGQLVDGNQKVDVAVKVLSATSDQGEKQFSTEIAFLSMLHHKNLVQIIGFCQHGPERILVYEYLAGGDLGTRLHGPEAAANPLNWKQRLQIALDAAQGLEYLHHLCSPSIVHRDVKSSNILLGKTLEAKVADFGLSKMISQDGELTADTTIVKAGTVGHEYIDPQFFNTNNITRESDVFSYGVILMEIITGRSPIPAPNANAKPLVGWVRTLVTKTDLTAIVDPLVANQYDSASMWEVIEIALRCTDAFRSNRPTMVEVARDLAQLVKQVNQG